MPDVASSRPPRRKSRVVRLAKALDSLLPVNLKTARDRTVAAARETVGLGVRVAQIPALLQTRARERKAGVLLYHNPEPDVLERHLAYLERRHSFVPYSVVVEAIVSGDWADVPPRCLAVTFDDGWSGNAALVPLLESFGVRPTIFLSTGVVGTRRRFWWTVDGLARSERDLLMTVPDAERIRRLHEIAEWTPTREYATAQTLTLDEIRELAHRVDFQAHTRFHPILPCCDPEIAEDEIRGSREDVESLTGARCLDLAYPNGRYGAREVELAARAGFRSARTIETGWNDASTDPFRIRILGMPDSASLNVVAAQSTGLRWLKGVMYLG